MKLVKQSILATCLVSCCLCSLNSVAHDLKLELDNIKKTGGTMMIALHNSEAGYRSGPSAFLGKQLPVSDKTMTVIFDNLPNGTYAIKLFHDENNNGVLDTNLIGIPREGYGFSNNGGAFGQPSFSDAKFTVEADTSISIHLR